MSKQGKIVLKTLYDEGVITLSDIQEFLDSKNPSKLKPYTNSYKQKIEKQLFKSKHADLCSGGGSHSCSSC
jgi:hypothetical protein